MVATAQAASAAAAAEAGLVAALADPPNNRNPYPLYRRMRESEPVHRMELGFWLVTSNELVREVLTSPTLAKDLRPHGQPTERPDILESRIAESLFGSEAPRHTRLRSLVNRAFSRRTIAAARDSISATADELIAERSSGEMDVVADLAGPLPLLVICELLGIPGLDRGHVFEWSHAAADAVDPIRGGQPEVRAHGNEAVAAFTEYLLPHVEACRVREQSNLVSDLVHAREEDDRLSDREVINMIALLVIAGHETTANQIGNAFVALLRHPEQLDRVRKDRTLLPQVIEEALRFDPPVQMERRRETAPTTIADTELAEEDVVVLSFGAANRDGSVWADPDEFDISREPAGHLAFGHGHHFCVGASLARTEIEIALDRLLDLPELELACDDDELLMKNTVWLRGYERIPIRFEC